MIRTLETLTWWQRLLHRHRLSEIAWLIDVCVHDDRGVIGGELTGTAFTSAWSAALASAASSQVSP
jgi:hypothetical protein